MTNKIKVIYKGKKGRYLFHPFNQEIKNGDILEVDKKTADTLILTGFEYVKEKKKEAEGGKQ